MKRQKRRLLSKACLNNIAFLSRAGSLWHRSADVCAFGGIRLSFERWRPVPQALGIVQTGEAGIAAVSSDQDWVNHCQSIPGRHTALLPVWETVLWVCIIE
jgi:hypothetical protein